MQIDFALYSTRSYPLITQGYQAMLITKYILRSQSAAEQLHFIA